MPPGVHRGSLTDTEVQPHARPLFLYRGEVEVAYAGDEQRHGAATRKYRIDGPGLENRGGFLWIDREGGNAVDMEIDLPDNPAWKSFKLRLERTEKLDPAAWQAFQDAQLPAAAHEADAPSPD